MKKLSQKIVVALLLVSVVAVLGCTSAANTPASTPVPTAAYTSTYKAPTATPAPIASEGFSRTNPANIGDTIYVKTTDYTGTSEYNIALEQVISGEAAWNMIKSANQFNSAPDAGKQYLLAKFKIGVTSAPSADNSYSLGSYDFEAVSSSGTVYDKVFVVEPEPQLSQSLYPGGSTEGWVALEVAQGDNPLIVYDRNTYSGTGGVWFKTS